MSSEQAELATHLCLNEQGIIVTVQNPQAASYLGSLQDVVGQPWWQFLYPADLTEAMDLWHQVLAHPRTDIAWQGCWRSAQDHCPWVRLTFTNQLAEPSVRAVVVRVQLLEWRPCPDVEATHVQGQAYDLELALARREFVLHYQPVVALNTGATVGFEALVRWQHPQFGLLQPAAFLPLAEACGLNIPLGRWVLQQALHQLQQWQAQFPQMGPLRMHVNVSPSQLTHQHFVTDVLKAVQGAGVQPEQLVLEITESSGLGTVASLERNLVQLQEFGVAIGLDDFGMGYSSLGRLHDLAIQYLKIDRCFLASMSRRAQIIVGAIVNLGVNLGMTVVAEGVERGVQRLFLQRLGCHLAQGYLFSEPLPANQIPNYLSSARV
ncbi:MAG: EAL domain-containing protein [Gloeomargarita sp. SKYBB_i_bin120]|nr:EAL domain-containing protein [Gloeomargarita sp. SKYG98]MCS7291846.1 EAL domain-containing protein [Gloeomargarita sp. SKYB120]MDW8177406.1 EAL domain-containing protein [Gloeomargarita sp. SKYBB_i_bin120]